MRKITSNAVASFKAGMDFSESNTVVKREGNLIEMFLHGNPIAHYEWGTSILIDNCGRKTNTTKERLNGILEAFELGKIFQKNHKWYIKNKKGELKKFDRIELFML